MISWQKQIDLRAACPLCNSNRRIFLFKKQSHVIGLNNSFFKCESCGFVYSEAALTPSGIEEFYKVKYQQSNYTSYAIFHDLKFLHFKTRLQKLLEIHKAKHAGSAEKITLLDLGCGEGISMQAAHALGLEATGVEVSIEAVELADSKNVGPVYRSNLDDLQNLKLGQFDLIVLFDVLDHVANPVEVLNSAVKLLKPGGTISIEVCNIDSLYAKVMGKFYTHIIPFEHFSYFSPATLKILVQKCGLIAGKTVDLKRPISLAFLVATLREFNPLLAKLISPLLIFKKLRQKLFFIPVGIISMTVHKAGKEGESHV